LSKNRPRIGIRVQSG